MLKLITLILFFPLIVKASIISGEVDYHGIGEDLFKLTNSERSVSLLEDNCLKEKAYYRAKKMYQENYFSHVDPATGKEPYIELIYSCSRFVYAGENLARGFTNAYTAHKALMNSQWHRVAILNKHYSRAGINCYQTICVELFGGY